MITKMVSNAVHAKLVDPTKEVRLIVSDILSYSVDGFEHMTKRPGWDGRSTFFSFKTNSFPAGFCYLVKRKLREAGSHGYLVEVTIPARAVRAACAAKEFVVRLEVDASLPGGLALYGERFGRYPLDPTIVLSVKD